jgi:hypothetical protein
MLHDYSSARVKGWVYDSSMPSKVYRDPALWPYSLNHFTIQDCDIGKKTFLLTSNLVALKFNWLVVETYQLF